VIASTANSLGRAREQGRFPERKEIKQLVRGRIAPGRSPDHGPRTPTGPRGQVGHGFLACLPVHRLPVAATAL